MVGKSKTVATSTKQHRHHPQQQQQQPTIINKQPPSLSAEAGITKSKKKKQKKENSPPTPFQQRVYALCRCIPAGKVSTYGAMATALKSSPRAVGQALRCNPYAPEVPCHRVIAATLELGGFTGSWGAHCASVQKKKGMLAKEGVEFGDGDGGKLKCPENTLMGVSELETAFAAAAQ